MLVVGLAPERYGDWLSEAEEDLSVAEILSREGKYAASCFHSQQAAEKAVEALLLFHRRFEPGHSVSGLLQVARSMNVEVSDERVRHARILDRYYIQTRYPNTFDRGAPHQYFLEEDASGATKMAKGIIEFVKQEIRVG